MAFLPDLTGRGSQTILRWLPFVLTRGRPTAAWGSLANCPSTQIDDDGPAWHLGALSLGKIFLNHYLIGPYNLVKQKPGKHSCFALTEAR